MAADEEFKTGTEPPEKPKSSPPERRGRRPGRGYRGRGRRPQQHQQPPAGEQLVETPKSHLEPSPTTSELPVLPSQERERPSPATIQNAIDDVNQIIGTLRDTLIDMEEVLETLELVERQNNADERELESLRRALRTMHRPREGGSQPARGHS